MTRWGTGAWDERLTVGVGGMRYVGALACFALIRRWRATFPTRGKASFGCATLFCFTSQSYRKNGATSQSYRKIGAVSNCYEPPREAFPRVVEGKLQAVCTPVPDEGEIGERTHIMPPHPAPEPSEAKGKILRHHPKSRLESPFGRGSKNPKASPQRAPENAVRVATNHLTGALCGEVLGVLRTFSERRF